MDERVEIDATWELRWKGLAVGDRNGGPIRLATVLYRSLKKEQRFDEEYVFETL